MVNYIIFTDSGADLSLKLIKNLKVEVIPLKFTLQGNSFNDYPDGREMSPHDFYDAVRSGEMPTTAQINTSEFIEHFEPYLKQGSDILYLSFSSGLSGTYNAARIAALDLTEKYPERKIVVVDTLAASMGEGLLIYYAAQKRLAGASLQEVAAFVEDNRNQLCHWFTVDDLNHLKRGGRISAAAALFGSMLGIKPVLHVDDAGHLIPMAKVRGRRASLDALILHMEQTVIKPEEQVIFISHGDCLKDAEYVADQIRKRWKVRDIIINYIGPVIGAHSGPGTVALFFFGSHK